MSSNPTRRHFLGTTAAAAATTWIGAPTPARGAAVPGPNDTIHLGLIGCGGEGRAVAKAHSLCAGAQLVAVCDLNATRMASAREQFGGEKVLAYHDYRKLLENQDIDAVIVGTNGHWHTLPTIHACQAGKDVYVEKPLGTSIGEGRAAVQAARKYNRIVQLGTQQRSWPHYQQAVKAIQAGKLGEISEVKVWDFDYLYPGFGNPPDGDPPAELDWDFWLGPAPQVPYNPNRYARHYWFIDYAGAWQVDWAVHHYDIVLWALGFPVPVAATAMGGRHCFEPTNCEWPDTFSAIVEFAPGPIAKQGFLMQYSFRGGCRKEQRSHAKCFFGTEASMVLDRSGYTIHAEARGGKKLGEEIETAHNAFTDNVHLQSLRAHAEVFLDSIRTRNKPPADVEIGHAATNPGHLMNIAWRTGRRIRWDNQREQIIDDPEAQTLITRPYRAPWKLEV
ncbi:MAG: Gfo/Idh/MocA family oxidoreductase [Candidatus Anammoximicrobium sp.]|nr:Gfo/Idh/MocA family oxidoreductase [Candidatus Anammoximicrobium sp.]